MDYIVIDNLKNTINENLKTIHQNLSDFDIDTLDDMSEKDLYKLNDNVNIEYRNFYGIN